MPELPEVETVRRQLQPVMRGARIVRVELRRADLRRPFPADFAERLEGRRVATVNRRGKYLLVTLDSGDTLLMHLGMSGSFRIDPPARNVVTEMLPRDRHDHVLFALSNGHTVIFNDPRRFGVMDVIAKATVRPKPDSTPRGTALDVMGPEPLSAEFNGAALAAAVAGKRVALKVALLDQRVVAGVGNIYASEALYLAHLSPRRRASTIASRSGRAKPHAIALAAAIKQVLRDAVARQSHGGDSRFRVYDREGEPCRTKGCGGTIRRITQAGRSTFYCPSCQK